MEFIVGFISTLLVLAALMLVALLAARLARPRSRRVASPPVLKAGAKAHGDTAETMTIAQIIQGQVQDVEAKASPDGRYAVVIAPYEMRMSHWVNEASLHDVASEKLILQLGRDLWSTDKVEWSSDSSRLMVEMRRYPGDVPGLSAELDLIAQVAHVQTASERETVPFDRFNDWLEEYYRGNSKI